MYETTTPPSWRVLNNLYSVINSKLQKLIQKLEFLTSRVQGEFDGSNSFWHETPSSFILDDDYSIYGRDNDIRELKHLLLSSDGDRKIGIIPLWALQGLVKQPLLNFFTTILKYVTNLI